MTSEYLRKQWKQFQKNHPLENIFAEPVDHNLFHWRGKIIGPSETPFEGDIFIVCSNEYSFKSPAYRIFDTSIMENPINIEVAQCFQEDREKYNLIVQQYTLDYAKESTIHDNNIISS